MKEDDVKALAIAANDLLFLIDDEQINLNIAGSPMKLGDIRQVLLNVEVALWPFESLLDVEEAATVVDVPQTRN